MELIAILVYIVICVLVVNVFDHKPSKPSNPEHVPIPNTGELVSKHFSWIKPGLSKIMNLNTVVQVRTDAYEYARNELLNSTPSKTCIRSDAEFFDISKSEVLHEDFGAGNYELTQIASYLARICNSEILSEYEFAGIILSFTQEQSIPYSFDKESTGHKEYVRFPLETIYDTTGDCDCKAVLACALFKTLGFRVALASMPGHAALAITLPDDDLPFSNFVLKGKRWFYCESTGDEWNPGQMPDGIDPEMVKLLEI